MSQPSASVAKLQAIQKVLRDSVLERKGLIDGMLTALIAKEMLFILGPPGTGKSKISEMLCSAISDARYFQYLMSKTSTPEELFGPFSLQGLKEDKYRRVTEGRLAEAEICFLDEIWKGNSATQNMLLPVINERKFFNSKFEKIPLQMMVAASNEIPSSDELSAIYDRFVLRYQVEALKDEDNFRAMLRMGRSNQAMPSLTLAELAQIQEDAAKMPVPDLIIEKMLELRHALRENEILVSDRKFNQSLTITKAFAYLQGHIEVHVEDLQILENVFWNNPDQIPQVRKLVRTICNPIGEVLQRHLDGAQQIVLEEKSGKVSMMEAFQKLQASKKELDALYMKHGRDDVKDALEEVGGHLKAVVDGMTKAPVRSPK